MFKISLVDKYLIKLIVPNIILIVGIFSLFAELVGISFEQIHFLFEKELSLWSSIYIHIIKFPYFFSITISFCLLFSLLITYQKLTKSNEFIALQACGINKYRLMLPALYVCIIFSSISLILNCYIVPHLNYKAAIYFEKELGIYREKQVKEKILYQEFDSSFKESHNQNISFIFYSDYFDGYEMNEVSIMKFNKSRLELILICESAKWNPLENHWEFFNGIKTIFSLNSIYPITSSFEKEKLNFNNKAWLYAIHNLENREMNINRLYKRLDLIKNTDKTKRIRKLKLRIYEKYANSFSCIIFGLIGCILGLCSNKLKNSQFIAFTFTFVYIFLQIVISSLCISGYIPVFFGVWIPNIISIFTGKVLLKNN